MNAVPLFFFPDLKSSSGIVALGEDIRKHAFSVLRMNPGEQLMLTNGKGSAAMATITTANKKQFSVQLHECIDHPAPAKKMILGISLLKNVPIWYELWRNINGFPPDYYQASYKK
jgi:RsmE family RNA methyltransferase